MTRPKTVKERVNLLDSDGLQKMKKFSKLILMDYLSW